MGNPFDEKAATWDADPVKTARTQAIADAIRQRVPLSRSMRALEYGCGTGTLSFALRSDLGRITLADSSEGMLAVLEQKIAAAGATAMLPVKLDLDAEDGSFHGAEIHHAHDGFDREELARKARAAGFAGVEFTTVFTMTRDDSPAQSEFPVFLMVAEKPPA